MIIIIKIMKSQKCSKWKIEATLRVTGLLDFWFHAPIWAWTALLSFVLISNLFFFTIFTANILSDKLKNMK